MVKSGFPCNCFGDLTSELLPVIREILCRFVTLYGGLGQLIFVVVFFTPPQFSTILVVSIGVFPVVSSHWSLVPS